MRFYVNVKPPNRAFYLERCNALRKCLEHAEAMPPFLVADQCLFVLQRALGGKMRVLLWLLRNIFYDRWDAWKDRVWWAWHLYVRLRTHEEIQEIVERQLERITGEDHREWPDVISDEQEVV